MNLLVDVQHYKQWQVIIFFVVFILIFFACCTILFFIYRKRKLVVIIRKIHDLLTKIDYFNVDSYFNKIAKGTSFNTEYQDFYNKKIKEYKYRLIPEFHKLQNRLTDLIKNDNIIVQKVIHKKKSFQEITAFYDEVLSIYNQYNQLINDCKKILKFNLFSRIIVVDLQDRFQKLKHYLLEEKYELYKISSAKLNEYINKTKEYFKEYDQKETKISRNKIENILNNIKKLINFLTECDKELPRHIEKLNNNFPSKLKGLQNTYVKLSKQNFNLAEISFDENFKILETKFANYRQSIIDLKLNEINQLHDEISTKIEQLQAYFNFEIISNNAIKKYSHLISDKVKSAINIEPVLIRIIKECRRDYKFYNNDEVLLKQWEISCEKIKKLDFTDLKEMISFQDNPEKAALSKSFSYYGKTTLFILNLLKAHTHISFQIWKTILKKYTMKEYLMSTTSSFYNEYNSLVAKFNKLNENFLIQHKNHFFELQASFVRINNAAKERPLDIKLIDTIFTGVKTKIKKIEAIYEKNIKAKQEFKVLLLKINNIPQLNSDKKAILAEAKKLYKLKLYQESIQKLRYIAKSISNEKK